ncbi:hypothetical protein QQ045_011843 [Rhodiola kirilowii]
MLQESNPGTVVFANTTPVAGNNMSIDRVFWAFGAGIQAFTHCRPIIGIDGTHLFGKYNGTLLVALGLDANNHLLPLAYALVESENVDSWSWFMAAIKHGVTQRKGLCVISDRHPGIMRAMREDENWRAPKAYHRICSRHLASNFNSRVKNTQLRKLMSRAAHMNQERKFNKLFTDLRTALKDNIPTLACFIYLLMNWWRSARSELWILIQCLLRCRTMVSIQ